MQRLRRTWLNALSPSNRRSKGAFLIVYTYQHHCSHPNVSISLCCALYDSVFSDALPIFPPLERTSPADCQRWSSLVQTRRTWTLKTHWAQRAFWMSSSAPLPTAQSLKVSIKVQSGLSLLLPVSLTHLWDSDQTTGPLGWALPVFCGAGLDQWWWWGWCRLLCNEAGWRNSSRVCVFVRPMNACTVKACVAQ